MRRSSPHAPSASGLTRRTTGLTDAHKQLIRILAEVAVEDFLAETNPDSMTEATADERKADPA